MFKKLLLSILVFSFAVISHAQSRTTIRLNDSVDLLTMDSSGSIEFLEELEAGTLLRFRRDTATSSHFRHIVILESDHLSSNEIASINALKLFVSKNILNRGDLVIDLRQGCEATGTCGRTNNRNRFTGSSSARQNFNASNGCSGNLSCERGMVAVCNPQYQIKFCIDKDLKKMRDGQTPEGNHTFYTCRNYCQSQGKRLPTNDEWLVASIGTEAASCLPASITSRPNPSSTRQMQDLSFNVSGIRSDRSNCKSQYGVRDMVGVLGQWVTGGFARSGRAQFNGGLWPQPASSIVYRTTAHGPGYTDYSIGCRCASDL